jgi:CDP-diacylglycerol---glycerol-3-phosphate 3-phosphatidyltransferase
MNIALCLTTGRIGLIPVFVLVYYLPFSWAHFAAACIFGFAALTDLLDGILARRLGLSTRFGAFLDPVADKLLVVIALVIVAVQVHQLYMTLPVCIIICRELIVSSLREWMAELGKGAGLKVSMVAKFKTAVQMMALGCLILYQPGDHSWFLLLGTLLMYLAVALTLWSMGEYIKVAMPDLTSSLKKQ